MADNKINVTVSANTRKNITVSSAQQSTEITASTDTGRFWAQTSKNWAVSDVIVDNTDYSSKHYAQEAKESAISAGGFETSTREIYDSFSETANNAVSDVQSSRDEALTEVENTRANAIESMNAVKTEAVDSINSTKTTILNDIEFVADGEKEEIRDIIDTGKDELKETIKDLQVLTTLEIGTISFTQGYIDESKGLRRCLNKVDNIILQDSYPEFTKWLKTSVSLNPSLACTESEWQTELTMSANNFCDKYVIDDEAGTIRLPKYPTYLDLTINTSGARAKTQTVSVYGTGMTLGFSNGSKTGGISANTNASLMINTDLYGDPWNTAWGSNTFLATGKSFGVTKDASKSGLTGSVTIPAVAGVTSEKIKGTYFIQVATGAETEDNIINEIELNNPFSLLDYKFSEYELNNISWLRSNGQYNSKAIYPAVYDLLLKIYNGTETKTGISVKLSTEEYTDYDFVLNTAEETFRLPIKVKVLPLGTSAPLFTQFNPNDSVSATSLMKARQNNGTASTLSGSSQAIKINQYGTVYVDGANAVNFDVSAYTYADLSNATIAEDLYLYFYVGETVQNANLVNIGRIQETMVTRPMVDGQWVNCQYVIAKNVACPTANKTYDVSSILPNDGYIYELLCDVIVKTGTTSGNTSSIGVTSDILGTNAFNVCAAKATSSVQAYNTGCFSIPVGNARQLILAGFGSNTGTFTLAARIYRRLGTNL